MLCNQYYQITYRRICTWDCIAAIFHFCIGAFFITLSILYRNYTITFCTTNDIGAKILCKPLHRCHILHGTLHERLHSKQYWRKNFVQPPVNRFASLPFFISAMNHFLVSSIPAFVPISQNGNHRSP